MSQSTQQPPAPPATPEGSVDRDLVLESIARLAASAETAEQERNVFTIARRYRSVIEGGAR